MTTTLNSNAGTFIANSASCVDVIAGAEAMVTSRIGEVASWMASGTCSSDPVVAGTTLSFPPNTWSISSVTGTGSSTQTASSVSYDPTLVKQYFEYGFFVVLFAYLVAFSLGQVINLFKHH